MSWNDERIKQLKKLWQKGKSAAEIGKALGLSKNAVLGKAHRLGLPTRPLTLKPEKKVTSDTPLPKIGKTLLMDLKRQTCHWPIGDPKDEDFYFCGAQCVTGKPYCPEHCKVAYTSLKELAQQNKAAQQAAMQQAALEDDFDDTSMEELIDDALPQNEKNIHPAEALTPEAEIVETPVEESVTAEAEIVETVVEESLTAEAEIVETPAEEITEPAAAVADTPKKAPKAAPASPKKNEAKAPASAKPAEKSAAPKKAPAEQKKQPASQKEQTKQPAPKKAPVESKKTVQQALNQIKKKASVNKTTAKKG